MTIFDMNTVVAHRRKEAQKPKPVTIEKRRCAAYKCTSRRTHSFPNLKSIWCSEHTARIVFDHQPPPPRTWFAAWRRRKEHQ